MIERAREIEEEKEGREITLFIHYIYIYIYREREREREVNALRNMTPDPASRQSLTFYPKSVG